MAGPEFLPLQLSESPVDCIQFCLFCKVWFDLDLDLRSALFPLMSHVAGYLSETGLHFKPHGQLIKNIESQRLQQVLKQ